MLKVWDNRSPQTLLRNAFFQEATPGDTCYLASPFFTSLECVSDLLDRGHEVRLIVRLCEATDADSLCSLVGRPRCLIRYYTGERFHAKLYIFGTRSAVVTSGNLTGSGLSRNAEIGLSITADHPEFETLLDVYETLWDAAEPLDATTASAFRRLQRNTPPPSGGLDQKVITEFGAKEPPNSFNHTKVKKDHESIFMGDYRRSYQGFLNAFQDFQSHYTRLGIRKVADGSLPYRLEIDQCLSWLRDRHIEGEIYNEAPLRTGADRAAYVEEHLRRWVGDHYKHLDEGRAAGWFAALTQAFGTEEAIARLDPSDIFDALCHLNAFVERKRFFKGGLHTFKKAFIAENDTASLQRSLTHLLHGGGDHVKRLAQVIYGPYRLKHFGRSAAQELLGTLRSDIVPVCNGRTTKSLRYLGYDVEVYAE